MTDTRELVDELRHSANCHFAGHPLARRVTGEQLSKAADTITALSERVRALEEAVSLTRRADDLREVYHSLPNDRNRIGDKRSRKSHARDAWLRAFRKAAKSARAALAGGRG